MVEECWIVSGAPNDRFVRFVRNLASNHLFNINEGDFPVMPNLNYLWVCYIILLWYRNILLMIMFSQVSQTQSNIGDRIECHQQLDQADNIVNTFDHHIESIYLHLIIV